MHPTQRRIDGTLGDMRSPRRTAIILGVGCIVWAGVALAIAGCGSDDANSPMKGLVVAGPGIVASPPPWEAQRTGLATRVAAMKLPKPGTERFHRHQALHIYNEGLLVPVAAGIGVDSRRGIESALHTHDSSGVVHMEASRPFSATLGDLFRLWGVEFGVDRIGGLRATSDRPLRVFVNGRPVADPATQVLAKNDNVVIAYGSMKGVPRIPDVTALRAANGKGGSPVPCSLSKGGTKPRSCFAPSGR